MASASMARPKARLLLLTATCCALVAAVAADIEVLEEWGCPDSAFRMTCRGGSTATLAILEASFSARDAASIFLGANRTCGDNHTDDGPRTIRAPLNHRCSGVNHCSFILSNDHPPSKDWGPGLVHIKYACVSGSHLDRYCGPSRELRVSDEGFLQSPGYPTITVGESACLWKLRAGRGQKLLLSVLDVSLRARADGEPHCLDVLAVREGGDGNADLVRECGERDEELRVESEHGALDVSLTTRSLNAFPSRGVLVHFKAVGCPSLAPPVDGYLVHRNESAAWYLCSVGHVFKDTARRERTLLCEHGNTWNDSLPACVNVSLTSAWRTAGFNSWKLSSDNYTKTVMAAKEDPESDTVTTIIVPTVIMAVLFLGNAVVLYVLFVLRKRNKKKLSQDEERAAIMLNNGSPKELKVEDPETLVVDEDKKVNSTDPTKTETVVGTSVLGEEQMQC